MAFHSDDEPAALAEGQRIPSGRSALWRALGAQVVALLLVAAVRSMWPGLQMSAIVWACLHGAVAALAAFAWRMPRWWWLIAGLFAPLAVLAQSFEWPPWVWLAGFVVLLLIFWRTDASQVPLYMTNSPTVAELAKLMPVESCQAIDLGCGDGRLLRQLARLRPDCQFVGYEHAPLTWLWAWIAARKLANLDIRLGSFWSHDLSPYRWVYAFLSPVPMPRLWQKACSELSDQARLISNSFPVPDVKAIAQIQVNDARQSRLWVYVPNRKA